MAKPEIRLNSAGIKALLHSDGVAEVLYNEAEHVLSEARRNAPVDTGAYKNSLGIEEATTDRVVVRVVAHDRKAALVESRRGVLSRALTGKARGIRRDRARERAAERRYDRQIKAEED